MAGLMDLFITIGVEDNASGEIEGISKSIGQGLKTAAGIGATAVAAVTAGVVALGSAFVSGASQIASYGDNIDKMSQKMGLTAQAYQEWDFILQHSGTSIDSMQRGMMTLTLAAQSGSDAFAALGMSQEQVASMSQDDLFAATIEGLQGISDEGERAALAQKLLGSAAKELGPLLNTSAEETAAMRKQVHDLGGVMSDDAVKAAAQFQDSLQNMKTALNGVKTQMLSKFLPSMSKVMDGVGKLFSGDRSGINMIVEGVKEFSTQIQEVVPELIEAATSILEPVISAVADVLPDLIITLLPVLISAVVKIVVALAKRLPEILSAIWTAISAIGAELWPVLESVFAGIGDWFRSKFEAAWEAIKGAWSGVGEFFSGIWDKITAAFDSVKEFFSGIFTPVKETIEGAFTAIKSAAEAAAEWVIEKWQPVSDFFAGLGKQIANIIVGPGIGGTFGAGLAGLIGGGGSHAIGNDYVPYNGYPAILHRGEAVLTAREAEDWRQGNNGRGVQMVNNFYGVSQSDLDYIVAYVNRGLA